MAAQRVSLKALLWLGFGGVLLPALTIGVELVTRICLEFTDVFPSWAHVGAVLAVPLANSAALWRLRRARGPLVRAPRALLLAGNALAVGVALYYSLVLVVVMPLGIIALPFAGLGLLVFAPLTSLLAAWSLRRRLLACAAPDRQPARRTRQAIAAVFIGLLAFDARGLLTDHAVHALNAGGGGVELALGWLRHAAGAGDLLHRAGEAEKRPWFVRMLRPRNDAGDLAVAYYRATGGNADRKPARRARSLFGDDENSAARGWVRDSSEGEQRVGQPLPALTLVQSTLEGIVEPAAAVGYTEWTLVFRNDDLSQLFEARSLVQLPAGGVVSRVTLWIDGEPCEAAFGGRGEVVAAYKAVVAKRRDPVLVTHHGPDQVLVQCFPVPARGGEMKVRLGITYPLSVDASGRARGTLPRFLEQNFSMPERVTHTVRLEAPEPLATTTPGWWTGKTNARGGTLLRGTLSGAALASGFTTFTSERPGNEVTVWAEDPHVPERRILQTQRRELMVSGDLALVLEGSRSLEAAREPLARALAGLPSSARIHFFIASDRVLVAPSVEPAAVAAWLREQRFVGGQDSTEALLLAHDRVARVKGAALLWVHGAQPHAWVAPDGLRQRFARGDASVALHTYAAVAGENAPLRELAGFAAVHRFETLGALPTDLPRVLAELRGLTLVARRSRVPAGDEGSLAALPRASGHVARLWVKEEVERLTNRPAPQIATATRLSAAAQLVTRVCGAVVLETQAQYAAAGLVPVDPATTPAIPEPATVGVIMAGVTLLVVLVKRRHSRRRSAIEPGARG